MTVSLFSLSQFKDEYIVPHFQTSDTKILAYDFEADRTKGSASTKDYWKLAAVGGWVVAAATIVFALRKR